MLKQRRFSDPIPKKAKIVPEAGYSGYTGSCATPSVIKKNQEHKYGESTQALANPRREKPSAIPRKETVYKSSPPNKKRKDTQVNITDVQLLLRRLKVFMNKNKSLKKEIEDVKFQLDVCMTEKAKALEECQSQENELKAVKKTVAGLQKENRQVLQLRSTVEQLQKQLNEREHEKQLVTSDLKLANTEQKLHISEVKRLIILNETLIKEKEQKEQLVARLEIRLRAQERTTERLKKQLEETTNAQNNERRLEIEVKSVLSDHTQLQSENVKLKQENEDLKVEIEKVESTKGSLSIQKKELQDKMASLYLDISKFESTIEELEKKNKTCTAELLKANETRKQVEKKNINLSFKIEGLKELLQDQKTEILSLNEEIRKKEQLLEEVESAKEARLEEAIIQKLSDENLQLKKEKSISIVRREELQQALQSKTTEVATLAEEIAHMKTQLSTAEFKTSAIKKENDHLKNKVECLEIYKSNLVKDWEVAKDQLDRLEREKLAMVIQNNFNDNEKAQLQAKLDDQKIELLCLQEKIKEEEYLNQELELLKKEREDLMEKNHNLTQKIQQLSAGFCTNFDGLRRRSIENSDKNFISCETRGVLWNCGSHGSNSLSSPGMSTLYQNPNLLTMKKEEKWFPPVSQAVVGTQTEVDSYLQEQVQNVERLERQLKQTKKNYSVIMNRNQNLKMLNRERCQDLNSLRFEHKLLVNEHRELKTNCWSLEENNEKLKRDYRELLEDYRVARRDMWEERHMKVQLYNDNKVIQEDLNIFKKGFRSLSTALNRT